MSDQLGLDECFVEVLPRDKAAKVKEVQSRYVMLVMTGDGAYDEVEFARRSRVRGPPSSRPFGKRG